MNSESRSKDICPEARELVIEPTGSLGDLWHELARFRELFFFLAWRDVKVRYKQTAIGVVWTVLQPLATVAVLVFIFGKVARLPSNDIPYPLLVFSALLPWSFFAASFSQGGNSLVGSANLLTKVYFPRIILPVSSMIVSLVDFLISFVLLVCLMVWYHFLPGWRILALPALLLLAVVTSLGAAFWISTLNVKYRDFRYIIPFVIQFGLYMSPVGFSSAAVPEKWRFWYSLNPMVGVIDGFRWALLGANANLYWPGFVLSVALAIAIFVTGVLYFLSMERTFADSV